MLQHKTSDDTRTMLFAVCTQFVQKNCDLDSFAISSHFRNKKKNEEHEQRMCGSFEMLTTHFQYQFCSAKSYDSLKLNAIHAQFQTF